MKEKTVPMRRCIGCMTSYPQSTLIRITCDEDKLLLDSDRRNEGRGVYLCRREECAVKARKSRAFNRCFRRNFDEEIVNAVIDKVLEECKEEKNG